MTDQNVVLTAEDFEVNWSEDLTYPFFEDEDATGVYGFGHSPKGQFAEDVYKYDLECNGEPYFDETSYLAEQVNWGYARGSRNEYGEASISDLTTEAFEGATPITWVSR